MPSLFVLMVNGYMSRLVMFVKRVRQMWNAIIACGNVVGREMVEELIINGGADIVKVGIGSGSVYYKNPNRS